MIEDILKKHGVYSVNLELELLRYIEKWRSELLTLILEERRKSKTDEAMGVEASRYQPGIVVGVREGWLKGEGGANEQE